MTTEEWQDHFHSLFKRKLDNIFEIAKDIIALHEEVNNDPDKWPYTWEHICGRVIHLSDSSCSRYEKIHNVLGHIGGDFRTILPTSIYTLHQIAMAMEANVFSTFYLIRHGVICRAMTREDSEVVLRVCRQTAGQEKVTKEYVEYLEFEFKREFPYKKIKGNPMGVISDTIDEHIAIPLNKKLADITKEEMQQLKLNKELVREILNLNVHNPKVFRVFERLNYKFGPDNINVTLRTILLEGGDDIVSLGAIEHRKKD